MPWLCYIDPLEISYWMRCRCWIMAALHLRSRSPRRLYRSCECVVVVVVVVGTLILSGFFDSIGPLEIPISAVPSLCWCFILFHFIAYWALAKELWFFAVIFLLVVLLWVDVCLRFHRALNRPIWRARCWQYRLRFCWVDWYSFVDRDRCWTDEWAAEDDVLLKRHFS